MRINCCELTTCLIVISFQHLVYVSCNYELNVAYLSWIIFLLIFVLYVFSTLNVLIIYVCINLPLSTLQLFRDKLVRNPSQISTWLWKGRIIVNGYHFCNSIVSTHPKQNFVSLHHTNYLLAKGGVCCWFQRVPIDRCGADLRASGNGWINHHADIVAV